MKVFESFRDPQGKVFLTADRVWRLIEARESTHLNEFFNLDLIKKWQQSRFVIDARRADERAVETFNREVKKSVVVDFDFVLFEHHRVEFPSFPYEWSPEMLFDAGHLTLDIAEKLFVQTGWSIKDASPFNVLFEGTKPIFVDVLSFEKRNDKDPLWLPYNQFVQTFIIPLLIAKETGVPLQTVFLANREGFSVAEAIGFFGRFNKYKPGVFSLVTLPNLLAGSAENDARLYQPKKLDSAEKSNFILQRSFRRLRAHLEKNAPTQKTQSDWTSYTKSNRETIPEYMRAKTEFVDEAMRELKARKVLDVGCNDGFFSFIAARAGARVIAIDSDSAVAGRVYQAAKKESLDVLPLVVDLSRPSPRLGWRNSENPSFLDRAVGRFDLVMLLAVIHHFLVRERIPLREILRLAADLTTDALIVELVPPDDKMFARLARGREHLHRNLTAETFTKTASEFFHIVRSHLLSPTERQIFLMRKK